MPKRRRGINLAELLAAMTQRVRGMKLDNMRPQPVVRGGASDAGE